MRVSNPGIVYLALFLGVGITSIVRIYYASKIDNTTKKQLIYLRFYNVIIDLSLFWPFFLLSFVDM